MAMITIATWKFELSLCSPCSRSFNRITQSRKGGYIRCYSKIDQYLNQGLINKLFMTQLQKIALKCFVKLIVCINYHHISLVQVRMHCIWLVSLRWLVQTHLRLLFISTKLNYQITNNTVIKVSPKIAYCSPISLKLKAFPCIKLSFIIKSYFLLNLIN